MMLNLGTRAKLHAVCDHLRHQVFALSILQGYCLGHRSLLRAQLQVLNTAFAGSSMTCVG